MYKRTPWRAKGYYCSGFRDRIDIFEARWGKEYNEYTGPLDVFGSSYKEAQKNYTRIERF